MLASPRYLLRSVLQSRRTQGRLAEAGNARWHFPSAGQQWFTSAPHGGRWPSQVPHKCGTMHWRCLQSLPSTSWFRSPSPPAWRWRAGAPWGHQKRWGYWPAGDSKNPKMKSRSWSQTMMNPSCPPGLRPWSLHSSSGETTFGLIIPAARGWRVQTELALDSSQHDGDVLLHERLPSLMNSTASGLNLLQDVLCRRPGHGDLDFSHGG